MLHVRVVSSPDWPEELREPWRELILADSQATPFQTWEWQTTWWKYFKRSRKPVILVAEKDAVVHGIMPLYRTSGPWRALRSIGQGVSDYLPPLARTESRGETTHVFAQWLAKAHADLVDLHQIRETHPLVAGRQVAVEQARCLVLDLPPTFAEYTARLSKSLRYEVKRLDKLDLAHLVSATKDNMAWSLDQFFELHALRWKKRGLPGAFVGSRVKTLQRAWAQLAVELGYLKLTTYVHEGEAIGSIYAMQVGETVFFYQAGFKPEAKAMSPGTVLVAHTIRQAIQDGATRFDFLRGDEPYKRRWKPQQEYRNLRLLRANTALGAVGLRVNLAESRVEDRIRARLEGRGLLK